MFVIRILHHAVMDKVGWAHGLAERMVNRWRRNFITGTNEMVLVLIRDFRGDNVGLYVVIIQKLARFGVNHIRC